MTVAELKTQIMSKQLQKYYIFAGEEIAVRDIYIKQIAKMNNYDIKWLESVAEVLQASRKRSMIGNNTLFILSEANELLKDEKSWKIFETDFGKNMLICMFSALDKRVKFYKQFKDKIVEFEKLQPSVLKKYIKKEIDLSDKNCDKLMELCEYDYGRCLLEIDKMKTYVKAFNSKSGFTGYSFDDCFNYFTDYSIIYKPPKDAIFDFVDAVMRRDAVDAFSLMDESYASGEATLVMITNLYNNFKALLQVQSCKSRDVSNCTGLTGWQIANAKKYLHKYQTGELVQALLQTREAEIGIKTGAVDEMVAVPKLLINIL